MHIVPYGTVYMAKYNINKAERSRRMGRLKKNG